MSRPRKPTAMLQLVGAFEKNPARGRARANEPTPEGGIGEPPATFSPDEKSAWAEIVSTSHAGVFCRADRISVEIAARLLAQYRQTPLTFPDARLLRLNRLLASFGMTPSDRSRVAVRGMSPGRKDNRFLALKGGR